MLVREIMEQLEKDYPAGYALDFDNVGLLAGRMEKEVKKIYIALDAVDEVIEDAARFGADLLITHHPLLFSPVKRVTDQDFIGKRLLKLIREDISCYAMHTNYDVLGMADLAAGLLGLADAEPLEVIKPAGEETGQDQGIGKIGTLEKPMTLEECCQLVKQRFRLDHVRVFGDLSRRITRAAVCPGSGKSVIREAVSKGAQVLITGDIGHHEGIDAAAEGLFVIDAGHYGTEYIFLDDMGRYCREHFPGLEIKTAGISHPFQTL